MLTIYNKVWPICLCIVYINVGSCKKLFWTEGIACFTPWVHSVCDVATASQPTLVNYPSFGPKMISTKIFSENF